MIKSGPSSSKSTSPSHLSGSAPATSTTTSPTSASTESAGFSSQRKKGWEAEDVSQNRAAKEPPIEINKNRQPIGLARPSIHSEITPFSLDPEHQRKGAGNIKKGTKFTGQTYQQMHEERAAGVSDLPGTASNRVKQILALRTQSLNSSEEHKHDPVPASERVNQLRHHRSIDASIANMHKDPTLRLPERPFPQGINRTPLSDLPLAQRPGPETRSNTVNDIELGRAMDKHGGKRLAKLDAPEHAEAVRNLVAPGRNGQYTVQLQNKLDTIVAPTLNNAQKAEKAAEIIIKQTPLSGGWEKPRGEKVKEVLLPNNERAKIRPVVVQAKSSVTKELWNPETKLITEARGLSKGYGHPQYNPKGNMATYVGPSGRGVRYDQLNTEHIAQTVDHNGQTHRSPTGQDIRTLRGFTNPAPFSQQGIAAESRRTYQDSISDLKRDIINRAKDRLKTLGLPDSQKRPQPTIDKAEISNLGNTENIIFKGDTT